MITKVVAEVVRSQDMGDLIECTVEYIVDTGDKESAIMYVKDRLHEGGWEIISIRAHLTWLHKINK